MQAVILAAGKGTRLKAKTDTLPKAMIEIEGKPLLEYSLDALARCGLSDVIIVVGFRHETITRRFGDHYHGLKIQYIENDQYAVSGSMYSLSLVQDIIADEILLLESDLLYEPRVLPRLLDSEYPNCILVAGLSGSGDEVYICTNEKQEIIELGKNISDAGRQRAIGELAGISRFHRSFLKSVFTTARQDFQKGEMNYHYEECVFRASRQSMPIHAVTATELAWVEIDTAADLQRAQDQIFPLISRQTE